jgi:hypothetical protein
MTYAMDDPTQHPYLRPDGHDTTRFTNPSSYYHGTYTPNPRRRNPPPSSLDLDLPRKSKSTSHLATADNRPPFSRRTTNATSSSTTTATPTTARRPRSRTRSQSKSSFFDPETLAFYTHLATKVSSAAREANGSTTSLRSALGATTVVDTADLPPSRAAPYSQRVREDPYESRTYLTGSSSSLSAMGMVAAVPGSSASSVRGSRRHSRDASASASAYGNGNGNGNGYREHCKPGSITPRQRAAFARMDGTAEGIEFYFGQGSGARQWERDEFFSPGVEKEDEFDGPDFVNLNARLEGLQEEEEEEVIDREYLKSLMKEEGRFWPWIARVFGGEEGRSDQIGEEDEDDEEEEYGGEVDPYELERRLEEERRRRRKASELRLQECTITPLDTTNDPPPDEDGGLLGDMAWLLSVAGKALLR